MNANEKLLWGYDTGHDREGGGRGGGRGGRGGGGGGGGGEKEDEVRDGKTNERQIGISKMWMNIVNRCKYDNTWIIKDRGKWRRKRKKEEE